MAADKVAAWVVLLTLVGLFAVGSASVAFIAVYLRRLVADANRHRAKIEADVALIVANAQVSDDHFRQLRRGQEKMPEAAALKTVERVVAALPAAAAIPGAGIAADPDDIPVAPPPLSRPPLKAADAAFHPPCDHGPPPVPAPRDDPNARPPGPAPRAGVFLTLLAVGLGLTASADHGELQMSVEGGKEALRRANYVKCETLAARAGDELLQAEGLYGQSRYDEAALICERHPRDGKAKLFLGLIAAKRGDLPRATELLTEARSLGSFPAERLLLASDWPARI